MRQLLSFLSWYFSEKIISKKFPAPKKDGENSPVVLRMVIRARDIIKCCGERSRDSDPKKGQQAGPESGQGQSGQSLGQESTYD